MDTLSTKVLARVQSLIRDGEPSAVTVTRVSEAMLSVDVAVTHTAAFAAESHSGSGHLSNDVTRLSSSTELQAELDARLDTSHDEAGVLLGDWAARHTDYCDVVQPSDCLRNRPPLGIEYDCGTCGGGGRVQCTECHGEKRVICNMCHGRGRTLCLRCHGHTRVRCWTCHGQGYTEKQDFSLNSDERQRTLNQQGAMYVRVPCTMCSGGTVQCTSCWGGYVNCGPCGQSGYLNCGRCGATGTLPCIACAATGRLNETAWIRCTVARKTDVDVASENLEDVHTLRERVPFSTLADLGPLVLQRAVCDANELTMMYRSTVPVEAVDVARGAKRTAVRGFGPRRTVFDYHGVVEDLLTSDLAEFERAAGPLFHRAMALSSGLGAATRQFLASEINALIATVPAAPNAENHGVADSVPTLLATNLVSRSYVDRAGVAIARALPRLYSAMLLPWAAGIVGACALSGIIAHYERLTPWSAAQKMIAVMLTAGAVWTVVELRAPRHLKGVLGSTLYERLRGRFNRLRRLSWGLAGGMLASALLGIGAAAMPASVPEAIVRAVEASNTSGLAMRTVIHEALALDAADSTPDAIRKALKQTGARITWDKVIDAQGTYQIATTGQDGYKVLGMQRVLFTFNGGMLDALSVSRRASGEAFKRRVHDLSGEVQLQKSETGYAFFRGATMQVTLSNRNGVMSEFYERLAVR